MTVKGASMSKRLRISACIAGSLLVGAAVSWAQQADNAPALGPLRMGMTPAEVHAALPDAAWTETAKSTSGVERTLSARDVSLLGASFDIGVEIGYHSFHMIRARRTAASDIAGCERLGLDTISGLEAEFGRFERSVAGDFLSACFNSESLFCMKNVHTVSTPGGSEVRRLSLDAKGQLIQPNSLNDRRIAIHGLAAERRFDEPSGDLTVFARHEKGSCRIDLMLQRHRDSYLQPERLSADRLRFTQTPTIGARHNAAIQLNDLPSEGLLLRFGCSVIRKEGGTVYCNTVRDDIPSATADVVRQAADQLVLDMTDVDRDDPAMLGFDYDLRLSPADIRTLKVDPAAAIPLRQVPGARRVAGRTLHLNKVSERLIHDNLVKPDMVFGVVCQVMEDYSLACEKPDTSGMSPLLGEAGLAMASRVRMPEQLADGSASLGRTVRITLNFQVEDPKGPRTITTR